MNKLVQYLIRGGDSRAFLSMALCGFGTALIVSWHVAPAFGADDQGRAQTTANQPVGINQIQHVVFLIKENRSFDHYFGTYPNAFGVTSGSISNGTVLQLRHLTGASLSDPGHQYFDSLAAINGGKMDGFDAPPPSNGT